MKRVILFEHGRLRRWARAGSPPADTPREAFVGARLYERLRRFDRLQERHGESVFTWYADSARAGQWVGVVQLPGLQIEVLPKVDSESSEEGTAVRGARGNLLYMLALAGGVPFRVRDVARLASRSAPISEMLAALFAERLLRELLRGTVRSYQWREENLRRFKGKLLVKHQSARNPGRRERFVCRYEEFSADTPMNRAFKAACRLLLDVSRTPSTQDTLRHCLLVLDPVQHRLPSTEELRRVVVDRRNNRFEDVFQFCQLVLEGLTPTVETGGRRSFSLLFDMNKVFEGFVATFLRQIVVPRIEGCRLLAQARTDRRHLLRSESGDRLLLLRPDLLLVRRDLERLVVDTKWKRTEKGPGLGGISASDLYQLHAYTHRYGCQRSVLLFPATSDSKSRDLEILDETGRCSGRQVLVGFADVRHNLGDRIVREQLADALEALVRRGLGLGAEGRVPEAQGIVARESA